MSAKTLPSSITSYDLFKTFAVLTMIIDHIGIYFFPDELWWRTVGRLSFPVWLFLVGYARSRDMSPRLMIGAGIVFLSNIVAGMGIFPLNILVTILVVRLCLDKIMSVFSKSAVHLWVGSAILFVVTLPSFIIFEFGVQAFILAIFGYLVRHQQSEGDRRQVFQYAVFVALGYIFLQSLGYALYGPKQAVLAIGMIGVTYALYHFKAQTFEGLTQKLPGFVTGVLQICGRRTLEIYVAHLVLFKAVALALGIEGFKLFQWSWVW